MTVSNWAKRLGVALLASVVLVGGADAQVVGGAKRLDLGATPLTGATSGGSGTGFECDAEELVCLFRATAGYEVQMYSDTAITLGFDESSRIMVDSTGVHLYAGVQTMGDAPFWHDKNYYASNGTVGGAYAECDADGGAVALTLDAAEGFVGRLVRINKVGGNTCTISVAGGDTLDGVSNGSTTISTDAWKTFVQTSDTAWVTSASYPPADPPVMTLSGSVASLPAAGVEGRLYYPTDSWYTYRDTGSTWEAFRNGRIMYPLDDSGWIGWQNESTATRSTSRGTLTLSKPIAASGDSQSLRYKTAPATPYTITACLRYGAKTSAASQYIQISIGGRESSSGKLKMITPFHGNGTWTAQASKWNSPTSYNSDIAVVTPLSSSSDTDVWVRMTDNGTNVLFDVSYDGFDWFNVATDGRTNFCTIDQIFVSIQATSAAYTGQVFTAHVLSWEEPASE